MQITSTKVQSFDKALDTPKKYKTIANMNKQERDRAFTSHITKRTKSSYVHRQINLLHSIAWLAALSIAQKITQSDPKKKETITQSDPKKKETITQSDPKKKETVYSIIAFGFQTWSNYRA